MTHSRAELYRNAVILDLCNLSNVFTGSALDDSASYTRIVPASSPIASAWTASPLRNTNSHAVGAYGSFSINNMSKFTTSNILHVLSLPIVAHIPPSALTLNPRISLACARKCFTNSTPRCRFFQNFKCPSIEAVTKKSCVVANATCVTVSRCMNDRSYIDAEGSASR